jgi:hypothetical protein
MMRALTTDATGTALADKSGGNGAVKCLADSSIMVTGRVTAYQTGGSAGTVGDSAGWEFDALLKNIGGTYTLVGSSIAAATTPTRSDAAAAAWTVQATATANGLVLTVTGEANKDITWFASMEASGTR